MINSIPFQIRYFPENLSKHDERLYQTNIASLAPDRIVSSLVPNSIVFFCFVHSKLSLFKPIGKSKILLLMIQQAGQFAGN